MQSIALPQLIMGYLIYIFFRKRNAGEKKQWSYLRIQNTGVNTQRRGQNRLNEMKITTLMTLTH